MNAIKGVLRVVRGSEIKLTLPGPSCTIKNDGTIWCSGNPILGITDPAIKAQAASDIKARRYERIPADAFCRMGDNPNGLWLGDEDMWASHPLKEVQKQETAEKAEIKRRTVRIYLSSRGWGDYSACDWIGDITRPDSEILAECKNILTTEHDVDKPNQSDDELLLKITQARESWETKPTREAARKATEEADIQHKIDTGYCFYCESWCSGDCGHYSQDPMVKFNRDLRQAQREANYGINDNA